MTPSDMTKTKHQQRYQRKKKEHTDLREAKNENDAKRIGLLKAISSLEETLRVCTTFLTSHTCVNPRGENLQYENLQNLPWENRPCKPLRCENLHCEHVQPENLPGVATCPAFSGLAKITLTETSNYTNSNEFQSTPDWSNSSNDLFSNVQSEIPQNTASGNNSYNGSHNTEDVLQLLELQSVDTSSMNPPPKLFSNNSFQFNFPQQSVQENVNDSDIQIFDDCILDTDPSLDLCLQNPPIPMKTPSNISVNTDQLTLKDLTGVSTNNHSVPDMNTYSFEAAFNDLIVSDIHIPTMIGVEEGFDAGSFDAILSAS